MAFDETRAYHNDWEFVGRTYGVSWERNGQVTDGLKARFNTITRDLISVAASLGLPTSAAAIVVWEPKAGDIEVEDWEPVLRPSFGHVFRKEVNSIDPQAKGEGWVVE